MKAGQTLFGGLIRRLLVGALEPGSPRLLIVLWQVADHVFPLVPLAPLNLSAFAEHLLDGLTQALAAIDNAKNAFLKGEATPYEVPQQFLDGFGPLGRRLRKP